MNAVPLFDLQTRLERGNVQETAETASAYLSTYNIIYLRICSARDKRWTGLQSLVFLFAEREHVCEAFSCIALASMPHRPYLFFFLFSAS